MEPPVVGPGVAKVDARLDVKTAVFEGPLELLLALAEREEVDIFQVSLARVTDAYLVEIASREFVDPHRGVAADGLSPAGALAGESSPLLEEMAEFLWMAARLLLLKSIRLLPGEPVSEDETDLLGWEEEVRKRLEEYRAYKQMAEGLMERAEQETFSFPPPARTIDAAGQEEPLEIGLLVVAFNSVLARIPPRPVVVTGRTWTLEEKLDLITLRLRQGPIELLELILESEDRLEAVVTFVAVLELLRRSLISVRQKERFGAIHIEAKQPIT
ncbi:MAG TPA: segregation/condensation protein A [Candidatus Dormibacteraeota bacterium]|nr:segregation/condensation protein A [Candidatus Dormibacteraeota bacterium]